jgi:hypothetical protein
VTYKALSKSDKGFQMTPITQLRFPEYSDDELTIMALEPWRATYNCCGGGRAPNSEF